MSLLVRLATTEENKQSGYLAQTREALDGANAQLESLKEYQASYLHASTPNAGPARAGPSNSFALSSYHRFIAQLDDAILQQESVVKHAEVNFERVKASWVLAREKRKSLERLRDQTEQQIVSIQNKKEEARILDDYVANKYRT